MPYTTFETSDRIGGNWAFGKPERAQQRVPVAAHRHVRQRLCFKDFPMPDHYPAFPHHTDIKAYLDEYADAFGLLDGIEFGNGVVTATRADGGGWDVTDQRGRHAAVRAPGRRQRTPLGPAAARLPWHVRRGGHPFAPLRRPADAAGTDGQANPGRRPRQQCRRHHRRVVVEGAAEHGDAVDSVQRLDRAEVHRGQTGRHAVAHHAVPAAVLATQGDPTRRARDGYRPDELRSARAESQAVRSTSDAVGRAAAAARLG